ncbi:MAG: penicillin-binding protein 2 [Leptospirales bacterium]|nr:penicillin-binding protein 2 [Leptospirales bacterium]
MSRSASEFRLEQQFQRRTFVFAGFAALVFAILVIQLGTLQLLHGAENRKMAKRFVSRQEFTVAPRGLLLDRTLEPGNPLVKNLITTDFVIFPSRFRDRDQGLAFVHDFCKIMGRDFAQYADSFEPTTWKLLVRRNESITLLSRMSTAEHERLGELRMVTEYGSFLTNHIRYYTMGPAAAHITGYIGLPSRSELDKGRALPYQMLGKGGIESRYDSDLRGTDGVRVRHRFLDEEEQLAESEQGNNVVLSIDRKVQSAAYMALKKSGRRGAAIAMRPATGEVLALVSYPSFDPNILASGSSDQRSKHNKIVQDYEGFLNIAIQAKFPPGSTFKPLVAIAALENAQENHTSPETSFYCSGTWLLPSSLAGVPPARFNCWNSGHGTNSMIGAIAQSCTVYFYQLGYKIGPNAMIHFSRAMGLDKKTGIDLPGEIAGFVPDQRWKQITWSSRWYDGDTVNLAIGQGFLEVTPIELAVLYSAMVNKGKIYRPYLVKEIRDPVSNRPLRRIRPDLMHEVPMAQSSVDIALEGMRAVVSRGTAQNLNRPDYPPIAGKTGTVQTRSHRQAANHAWFAGWAPYDAPVEQQVVVVVFVEYGMGGSAAAAPIAGEILDAAVPDWTPNVRPSIKGQESMRPNPAGPADPLPAPAPGEKKQ